MLIARSKITGIPVITKDHTSKTRAGIIDAEAEAEAEEEAEPLAEAEDGTEIETLAEAEEEEEDTRVTQDENNALNWIHPRSPPEDIQAMIHA